MSAAPPPNPANQMPEPPRQKRAYTKRGTGATAMKKQKALKGGLSKMYQGRAGAPARLQEQDRESALATALRCGRQLCGCSDERVALKCVNLLLVITRELEVPCLEAGDFYDDESPLLNGLATMLDRCLPPGPLASSLFGDPGAPPLEDDVDPWAWRVGGDREPAPEYVDDFAARASSPLCLAVLTVLRNVAQTASNRSAIAHHDRCLRHVLVLLEPPLLGLESATLCVDVLASVGRHVELGGAFLESRPLRHYLARGGGGARDDALKNGCALAGIAPPGARAARALGGGAGDVVRRRATLARRCFRAVRLCLHYGAAPGALAFLSPADEDDAGVFVGFDASAPMERYAVRPGATLREGGRDAARAHQRHVALRALETLASFRNSEWNAPALDETPADVVRLSAERLARAYPDEAVDSEARLAGLEALTLLADRDAAAPVVARLAAFAAAADLALAAIVATHVKYLDAPTAAAAAAAKPAPAPAAGAPAPAPAAPAPPPPPAVLQRSEDPVAGVVTLGPRLELPPPPPPTADEDCSRLAPPRSLRAETVRSACQFLATLASHDAARAAIADRACLLLPAAANNDDVADLVFNKLM